MGLAPQLGSGPVWFNIFYLTDTCADSWWKNMLFADVYDKNPLP